MPCNLNHRRLALKVAEAVEAAGGVALEFNTIAVSDNQSQATPGMRASLVSREVIADSIELMVHAHDFDSLVCLVGCDKTVPAALMALARVDRPAVVLSGGPMLAGRDGDRALTIQDVWEAVGAHDRGRISREQLDVDRARGVPRRRLLRGQLHRQHDGDRRRHARPRRDRRRADPRRRRSRRRTPRRGAPARWRCSSPTTARPRGASSTAARSRTRWPGRSPAAARPTASCTCWRSRARRASRSRSTSSPPSARARRCSPTSCRAGASSPRTCTRRAGRRR